MIYTKDNPKLVFFLHYFDDKGNFTGVVKTTEWSDGRKDWYLNGERHREDGPAIEYANGDKGWYLNGKRCGYNDDYTNKSWIRFVQLQLLK